MSTEIIPYQQMQLMATAAAKSGLFAVKTPEAAFSLMLVAASENIHPGRAMMEYDVIQGKPCLKASAMLARFQAAGGKVRWIEQSDTKVSGEFSHPAGGAVTVTWDTDRVKTAQLDGKDMHKKFPLQMKRARCISEGVRAVFPGVSPVGMYTPEETADMDQHEVGSHDIAQAIQNGELRIMASDVVGEYIDTIKAAANAEQLRGAYQAAHKAAVAAKDGPRIGEFALAYEARKEELATVPSGEQI